MNSLLPVLVAHLLVDIACKTEQMRLQKSRLVNWGAYLRHGLLVWVIMLVAISWSQGAAWRAFFCALAIAGVHLGIDLSKYLALRNGGQLRRGLTTLFLDCHETLMEFLIHVGAQIFHIAAIYTITGFLYPPRYDLANFALHVQGHLLGTTAIPERDQMPYLALLYLMGTVGGARVIQFIERAFYPGEITDITLTHVLETENSGSPGGTRGNANYRHTRTEEKFPSPPGRPGVSYWVGILERLLIMLWPLIPTAGRIAIPAVLGIKSIARLNQLKHRAFVEYFIVGTLASVTWGALFAWLVSLALKR